MSRWARLPGLQDMKILVLGATGNTGRQVVDVALQRGHEVTAYVRSPRKVRLGDERLRVEQGDALDSVRLTQALVGTEAVISVLGLPARRALRPSTFMAEAAAVTVAAMKRANVSRLAILSAAVLFPQRGLFYAFFRWFLRHHARDLTAMEAVVMATDLQWTIARPPRLVRSSDESTRTEVGTLPDRGFTVSFRAVARYLVEAVENDTHARQIVGLAAQDGRRAA
jgi:putative NADH-flavin reductase